MCDSIVAASGFGSYMAYPVSVKKSTDDASSVADDALMLRRFSDFWWLRETIVKEYFARLIPPMPPKHSMQGNHSEEGFLEIRRAALEKFVERLMKHPVLSRSKALDTFLHSKNHELGNRKKEIERLLPVRKVDAIVSGKALLKKKTENIANLTAEVAKCVIASLALLLSSFHLSDVSSSSLTLSTLLTIQPSCLGSLAIYFTLRPLHRHPF